MSGFTRLTVRGARRRAEVVVSSDEPLGAALPRLLDLLRETDETVSRPVTLVRTDGDPVDVARTPEQLALHDGAMLRLVRLDSAPPPPVVIDVVDVAAQAQGARPDRWDDRSRRLAGAALLGLGAAVAAAIAPFGGVGVAVVALSAVIAALLALAVGIGWTPGRRLAVFPIAAAAGVSLPFGAAVAGLAPVGALGAPGAVLVGGAATIGAASLAVLAGAGGALRRRGAAAGGAVGVILAGVPLGLVAAGVGPVAAAAIAGALAAFATGPLPWIALSAAGLDALDRRVGRGKRLTRPRTIATIDEAYDALSWSVAAVAAPLALCGAILVAIGGVWNVLLGVAFAFVAALRSRAFPLRVQVASLWAVAAVIGLTGAVTQLSAGRGWTGVAAITVVALILSAGVSVRPAPPTRARLRRLGNLLESVGVIAIVPLLLGALDVYRDLLGMFAG